MTDEWNKPKVSTLSYYERVQKGYEDKNISENHRRKSAFVAGSWKDVLQREDQEHKTFHHGTSPNGKVNNSPINSNGISNNDGLSRTIESIVRQRWQLGDRLTLKFIQRDPIDCYARVMLNINDTTYTREHALNQAFNDMGINITDLQLKAMEQASGKIINSPHQFSEIVQLFHHAFNTYQLKIATFNPANQSPTSNEPVVVNQVKSASPTLDIVKTNGISPQLEESIQNARNSGNSEVESLINNAIMYYKQCSTLLNENKRLQNELNQVKTSTNSSFITSSLSSPSQPTTLESLSKTTITTKATRNSPTYSSYIPLLPSSLNTTQFNQRSQR